MRLGLIRHGETDWNAEGRLQGVSDVPLNALGRSQAESAGRMLAGQGWDRVYASPLSRAFDTASIIAEHAGLPEPVAVPELVERSYGELEGESVLDKDGQRVPLEHPSVEAVEVMLERSLGALQRIVADHPDENVIVVSHGTVIRNLLDSCMPNGAPRVLNTGFSVLEPTDDGYRVLIANGYPQFDLDLVSGR